jgi:hypothetical protein
MHRTLRAALMAAVFVGASQSAQAQGTPWEDRVFANLSFGVDTGTTSISQNRSFIVYNETGTLQADAEFGSFPIFDITVGARVFKNVAVAIAYHTGGTTGDGTLTGTVPHPQFFDRPRTFSEAFDDAERDEHATHLQIGWMAPLGDNFDLLIFGGPSFYRVTQELPTELTFVENGPPYTTVTVQANVQRLKKNTTGYNFGFDGTYFLKTTDSFRLGVGGMLRFTGATATFNVDGNDIDTDAGGVQFAVGARLRF